MTKDKATTTNQRPNDTHSFSDIPSDLVARLTREADRRCIQSQHQAYRVPLAHQVILARRSN